tara:strand:+ start:217 stop:456 length:240 start_codon:yes stop_codon:yes gene_type:complete
MDVLKVDLDLRRNIAQVIVDMYPGEKRAVKPAAGLDLEETFLLIKEVNATAVIGHALRFTSTGEIHKYRKTAIEIRLKL